ncbi:Nif11-like leader peptide family natural product precursor [Acaryochloris sp. 'Moss Beach']|uniref:Nif11-like leader peptide family natural product precursor n=1 Tax=Acaryochloris TaxID=155977 RepID=UPI001BB035EF|nr:MULTISPECIES: Nif11-like leader peptide family natural product precursor [Acaryochloris]QUY40548.1 Nif11-like leader peptide family natural product precursor [Acaryochloris marina S15]UJB69784.1 Nif11-like leader peptide family natural product precursor [Acaryochloris sp. 'Moss Beach']
MAKTEFARLFRATQENPTLRQQLNAASNQEEFVSMAQMYGYDFTVDEWQEMIGFNVEELQCELSEIPGI